MLRTVAAVGGCNGNLKRELPTTAALDSAAQPPPAKVARAGSSRTPPPQRHAQPFPPDRSTALFDWIGCDACGEAGQVAVVNFLGEEGVQLPQDEDGELELDPEALDDATLWKLDRFCQQQSRGMYAPAPPPAPPRRGPVVADRGYLDDDSEEE